MPAGNRDEVVDAIEYAHKTTGKCWQSEFFILAGRGPKPFSSVKILDGKIEYEEHINKREDDVRNHSALAQALAEALAPLLKGKKG